MQIIPILIFSIFILVCIYHTKITIKKTVDCSSDRMQKLIECVGSSDIPEWCKLAILEEMRVCVEKWINEDK